MKYCVIMECTLRIAVWFDAPDDEAAEEKAAKINQSTDLKDFEHGDAERDYAPCNADNGRLLLDWD